MTKKYLYTLVLLTTLGISKIAFAQDCRNVPNPLFENNLLMQTTHYRIKQNNYEAYSFRNDTELYGVAYEGLISAILDRAHICVIEKLIYDFDPNYIDINASNYYGMFPLLAAVQSGNLNIIWFLLNMPETNVNKTDHVLGSNALMEASFRGNLDVVNTLLSTPDLKINIQNNMGMTALMYAVQNAHSDIVATLLSIPEIDISLTNLEGETALEMAERVVYGYGYLDRRLLDRYNQIIELLK